MKRRVLAALAAVALCVCAFPAHALASTPQDELDYLSQEVYGQSDPDGNDTNGTLQNGTNPWGNMTFDPAGNGTVVIIGNTTLYEPVTNETFIPTNGTITPGNGTIEPEPSKIVISRVAVVTKLASRTYTGQQIKPRPTVRVPSINTTLKLGTDYTLSYGENVNAGTGSVYVIGKGNYTGAITVKFAILKAENKITKVTRQKTLKYKALKKGNKAFTISARVKGKAKKVFKKVSASSKAAKYIKVSKAGKVTVKKGLKKGTYKLRVKITAKKTANYQQTSVTKTITIYVK